MFKAQTPAAFLSLAGYARRAALSFGSRTKRLSLRKARVLTNRGKRGIIQLDDKVAFRNRKGDSSNERRGGALLLGYLVGLVDRTVLPLYTLRSPGSGCDLSIRRRIPRLLPPKDTAGSDPLSALCRTGAGTQRGLGAGSSPGKSEGAELSESLMER